MMKIKTHSKDGRPVVLLGFSHGNLDRLRADGLSGYIEIKAESLDIPFDILITAAETEQALLRAFEGGIGPNTKLRIDPRLKS